jgi:hypothetical protein
MSEKQPVEGSVENTLKKLRIEARKARKRTAYRILGFVALTAVFILIGYSNPQFGPPFFVIGGLIGLVGALYIIFFGISHLVYPLQPEQRAFKKIAEATDLLEASNEEAHDKVRDARGILNDRYLTQIGWYAETNSIFTRLLENIQLIVIPAIEESKMKKEDLERTALAIVSMNPAKAEEVNDLLEKNYTKANPEPSTAFLTEIRHSTVGRVVGSLLLGYGLILVVSAFYVLGTGENLGTFLKERPDIVIIGGLIASGITFWKAKNS